jgi:hypothetical protein
VVPITFAINILCSQSATERTEFSEFLKTFSQILCDLCG